MSDPREILIEFEGNPEALDAVNQWAVQRMIGAVTPEKAGIALIERLEYLLFLAGSRHRDEEWYEEHG